MERVWYVVVAASWAWLVPAALESMAAGGSHSRRDLNHVLMVLLIPSGALLLCAATSRLTTAGAVLRWITLGSIVLAFTAAMPFAGLLASWVLLSFLSPALIKLPVMFFGAMAILAITGIVLLRAVLTPAGKPGPPPA